MVLTIKHNLYCNARCDYCNVPEIGRFLKTMDDDTIYAIVKNTEDFIQKSGIKSITVVFHGGEPLLAPDSFFKTFLLAFESSKILKDINIKFTIQTNLTMYHEKEWPSLKKLLGTPPHIGTSYDPMSKSRKLANKASYEEAFLKSYFKFVKEDKGFVNFIYPVTKEAFGKEREVYRFYKNLGVKSLTIKPVLDYDGTMSEDELYSAYEYGEFLKNMYALWVEDDYGICIEPFNGWTLKHKTGSESQLSCYFNGKCSNKMFLVLPNGDIFECCEFTRMREKPVGNIHKDSLYDLHLKRGKKIKDYYEVMAEKTCQGCKWWDYCHGYCPIKTHGEEKYEKHFFCEGYMHFFDEVFKTPYSGETKDIQKIKKQIKELANV